MERKWRVINNDMEGLIGSGTVCGIAILDC